MHEGGVLQASRRPEAPVAGEAQGDALGDSASVILDAARQQVSSVSGIGDLGRQLAEQVGVQAASRLSLVRIRLPPRVRAPSGGEAGDRGPEAGDRGGA